MERPAIVLILSLILAVIYIVSIGTIASFIHPYTGNSPAITSTTNGNGGSNIQLGVGEGVHVSVVRNRWYGQITEENGITSLRLFNLVKIPLKVGNFNFMWVHGIIFIVLIALPIMASITHKRRFEGYDRMA